ncbi:MAG: hypothetical protein P8016_08645 [Sedimentisphaerales bacterium]
MHLSNINCKADTNFRTCYIINVFMANASVVFSAAGLSNHRTFPEIGTSLAEPNISESLLPSIFTDISHDYMAAKLFPESSELDGSQA